VRPSEVQQRLDREETDMSNANDRAHVTIIVNTREKVVPPGKITFEEVVALAFDPVPSGPLIQITVSYFRAQGNKSGDLLQGQSVAVHEGMVFDVTATDLS
jgi:hypothetical protein